MYMMEFQEEFGTKEQCREYLFPRQYLDGSICPKCGRTATLFYHMVAQSASMQCLPPPGIRDGGDGAGQNAHAAAEAVHGTASYGGEQKQHKCAGTEAAHKGRALEDLGHAPQISVAFLKQAAICYL